jgi:hypothetical protein
MKKILYLIFFIFQISFQLSNSNSFLRFLQPGSPPSGGGSSSTNTQDYSSYQAINKVSSNTTISSELNSTNSNESALYVGDTSAVVATVNSAKITKSGDYSGSSVEPCEFYGLNAAILVNGAKAVITNTTVSTSAKGGNAVFVTNDGEITVTNSNVTSTASSSARGFHATYGGTITGTNVIISTTGGSCASLATDRGEGTVSCTKCTLSTSGAGSPVIYSTGDITIQESTGNAQGAQMVVVEGKNSATVKSSTLQCTGVGNRNNVDKAGIMIYQSESGDADSGKGSFTASDSTMEIVSSSSVYSSAPMFFVTNTEATITLSNVTFKYGSGIFIDIEGTDQWGTSGSNGGVITMTVTGQTIEGDIVVDDYSSLSLTLSSSSSFTGKINAAKSSGTVSITIDASSKLTLTGDSYVTTLTNADSSGSNIEKGDYSLNVGTISNDSDSKGSYLKGFFIELIILILFL